MGSGTGDGVQPPVRRRRLARCCRFQAARLAAVRAAGEEAAALAGEWIKTVPKTDYAAIVECFAPSGVGKRRAASLGGGDATERRLCSRKHPSPAGASHKFNRCLITPFYHRVTTAIRPVGCRNFSLQLRFMRSADNHWTGVAS